MCSSCEDTHVLNDVRMNWKCPNCEKVITIHAIKNNKEKVVVNRIHPSEINKGMDIYIKKHLDILPCEVTQIKALTNGSFEITALGNGVSKFTKIEYVNRHEGTWR